MARSGPAQLLPIIANFDYFGSAPPVCSIPQAGDQCDGVMRLHPPMVVRHCHCWLHSLVGIACFGSSPIAQLSHKRLFGLQPLPFKNCDLTS
jgi:hypothetical protein